MININSNFWLMEKYSNSAALVESLNRLDDLNPLRQVYSAFNGEKSYGAWRPGFSFSSLEDLLQLMDDTSDSWEWLEEEHGQQHFMRNFFPFLSTISKTSVGVVLKEGSTYDNHVIEYHYETGDFRIWSVSVQEFFDAFFGLEFLSEYRIVDSLEFLYKAHIFTTKEKSIIRNWTGIRYPLLELPYLNISETI